MYRVLIVNSDSNTIDKLYDCLSETEHLELEIYKAFSLANALEILNRTKIDIAVTDFNMPGINGIDLLENIGKSWPNCKVIIYTDLEDFDSIKAAFRNHAVNYVLKTEDDAVLLRAVEKAVKELEEDLHRIDLIYKANHQMELNTLLLQKEYIIDLLEGEKSSPGQRKRKFNEFNIALDSEAPLMLILGRIDHHLEDIEPSAKAKLLYSIQSIAEQYFSTTYSLVDLIYERKIMVWLIQPVDKTEPWERTVVFTRDTLESVQNACRELLKFTVSFSFNSNPVNWEEVSEKFKVIKSILVQSFVMGKEMILQDCILKEFYVNSELAQSTQIPWTRGLPNSLAEYLENGQKAGFNSLLNYIIDTFEPNKCKNGSLLGEIYFSVALVLLSHINRYGLMNNIAHMMDIDKLMRPERHQSWNESMEYLYQMAQFIFDLRKNEENERMEELVRRIKNYVKENLHGDTSLIKLSEQVYLNPSYLSRLFKQITGQNISDYINNEKLARAKELLMNSDLKIYEIASAVGYDSVPYFTRFFKKSLNMTPQEYRNSMMHG
jgi:two-component system response regulator YesN